LLQALLHEASELKSKGCAAEAEEAYKSAILILRAANGAYSAPLLSMRFDAGPDHPCVSEVATIFGLQFFCLSNVLFSAQMLESQSKLKEAELLYRAILVVHAHCCMLN
jgi:hypothetical protein